MVIFLHLPSDEDIEAFENSVLRHAYRFTDRALIREALQCPGIFNPSGQQTLALVGDATLRLFLVDQGRERVKTPGEIQDVISKVASNENLYCRGISLGVDPFIVKNPGQMGMPAGENTMATTIEAIIGAVFYDSGKNRCDIERVLAIFGLTWPE